MKKLACLLFLLVALAASSFSVRVQAQADNLDKPVGYLVEQMPTDRGREYHFNKRITDREFESVDTHYQPRTAFYTKLKAVNGVTDVTIKAYSARVVIAKAFDWKDVEPTILQVFTEQIGQLKELPLQVMLAEDEPVQFLGQRNATDNVGPLKAVSCPTPTTDGHAIYSPKKKQGFRLFRRIGRFLF